MPFCFECGKTVSSSAPTCPHCGAFEPAIDEATRNSINEKAAAEINSINEKASAENWESIGLFILIAVIGGLAYYAFS